MERIKISKILAIDPANKQTAYVIFNKETFEIYDKDLVPNDEFIQVMLEGNYDEVALEIIVNMGMAGKTVFRTAEYVGIYSYLANKMNKELYRISRPQVKKHFKVKRSTKKQKQPSADSQIRTSLINRFGEVGTKKNQGYFYGFKADIWQAMAVGVYHADTSKDNTKK